jgi:hypothetical protein
MDFPNLRDRSLIRFIKAAIHDYRPMLQLHFLGVHHVFAIFEELRSLGELADVIVKPVQYLWHLCQDERLRFAQNSDRFLVYHVETEPLLDRAFFAHLSAFLFRNERTRSELESRLNFIQASAMTAARSSPVIYDSVTPTRIIRINIAASGCTTVNEKLTSRSACSTKFESYRAG